MAPTLNFAALIYLFWVIVLVPVMGIVSWYRIRSGKPLPPKEKRYRAMIVLQIWLIVFSLTVMQENRFDLFARGWSSAWAWAVAAAYMGLLAHRVRAGWRKLSDVRKHNARRLLPENFAHLRYWVPISLLAGISEELAFRGVAFVLLTRILGSASIAVCVCVLSFGVGHMLQGWRGVLAASLIGLAMHWLVYVTGGLYMPMAVHAVYDLIVGLIAARVFTQQDASQPAQSQAASRSCRAGMNS